MLLFAISVLSPSNLIYTRSSLLCLKNIVVIMLRFLSISAADNFSRPFYSLSEKHRKEYFLFSSLLQYTCSASFLFLFSKKPLVKRTSPRKSLMLWFLLHFPPSTFTFPFSAAVPFNSSLLSFPFPATSSASPFLSPHSVTSSSLLPSLNRSQLLSSIFSFPFSAASSTPVLSIATSRLHDQKKRN